jgi:hypothetical protein
MSAATRSQEPNQQDHNKNDANELIVKVKGAEIATPAVHF